MPAAATLTASLAPPAHGKPPQTWKSPAPHSTEGPSNISLFLTGLRLLDLDKHPDWPSITRHTFSTKDAQQSQKNRIRCVEWALYRLFEIWDSEGTRNKLQPFFPPLEPLQSINLRAALFRCLSELKKDGVLGRDMVLRKTMLDECKGERFEELLAVFAAVVLKKKLLHDDADFTGLARRLATATRLTVEEQSLLKPLVIAHRASLASHLRGREEMKERYEDFARLLELKRRQAVRREEELRVSIEEQKDAPAISDEEGEVLKRQWQENWLGDDTLLNIVIDGNARRGTDVLLNERYSLIWEKVEDGVIGEVEDMRGKTLLEDLDGRILDQKLRLERWKVFNGEFCKQAKNERRKSKVIADSSQKKQVFNLSFEDHEELVPGRKGALKYMSATKTQVLAVTVDDTEPNHEYKRLMQTMQAELAKVGKSRRNGGPGWRMGKRNYLTDFDSGIEKDERTPNSPSESLNTICQGEGEAFTGEVSFGETTKASQSSDIGSSHGSSIGEDESRDDQNTTITAITNPNPDRIVSTILKPPNASLPLPEQPEKRQKNTRLSLLDPEGQELLAEQIISSVTNSDPSPTKPLPSLVERTRMSMAFKTTRSPIPDPPNHTQKPPPMDYPPSPDQAATLLDRTRKSMSTFQPKPQPRPRKSIHPPKPSNKPNPSTPPSARREELFSQEADYASVFKSRPKIALSPTFSPVDRDEEGLPGIEDSLELGGEWDREEESPLAGRRGRGW
ncbi:MAG: hypothetical protein M1839_000331 [Geoglossum umbratile]|nr:MAG: hypothetical protein M1839_000331 [Geoglossum umbratile]